MVLSVKLPKMVAIMNSRLAFAHYFMVFVMFGGLCYFKFVVGDDHLLYVDINTKLEIAWKDTESIEAMGQFFQTHPEFAGYCQEMANADPPTKERWGVDWAVEDQCVNLCKLDTVLTHGYWPPEAGSNDGTLCFSDFKAFGMNNSYTPLQFMEVWGKHSVILMTGKQDWIVDHEERTRTNYVEVVPQGLSATVGLKYTYTYLEIPPMIWPFSDQHDIQPTGTNEDASTILLDQAGIPVATFQPGEAIDLEVEQILTYLNISAPQETMLRGSEVAMTANCFGTNKDLNNYLEGASDGLASSDVEATLRQPACAVRFMLSTEQYQVAVEYGSASSDKVSGKPMEVMSETTGLLFRVEGGAAGHARVHDLSLLVLNVTSMLVLLALPKKITFFVVARMLGPMSRMYKRSIIEPYDVEECALVSATVIASNQQAFHALKKGDDDETGVITESTIKQIILKAFGNKHSLLNADEMGAFAHFLYKGMNKLQGAKPTGTGTGMLEESLGIDIPCCPAGCSFLKKKKDEGTPRPEGITSEQWNLCRMQGEKITFAAVGELFDKDRPRSFLEMFFTPRRIRKALKAAEAQAALRGDVCLTSSKSSLALDSILKSVGLKDGEEATPNDIEEASFKDSPRDAVNPFAASSSKASGPDVGALSSELEALAERLTRMEGQVSQDAKPHAASRCGPALRNSGQGEDFDSSPPFRQEQAPASCYQEQAPASCWKSSIEPVHGDISGVEKRLRCVEQSLRTLSETDMRSLSVTSDAAAIRAEAECAWAEAVLRSFGPNVLPEAGPSALPAAAPTHEATMANHGELPEVAGG